jgi:hypothetical protein
MRSQRILIVLIVMAMLVPCLIVLPKNVKGGSYNCSDTADSYVWCNKTSYVNVTVTGWKASFTSLPPISAKPTATWLYRVTTNESATVTVITKPSWATWAAGNTTLYGAPGSLSTWAFEVQAVSASGLQTSTLYWNVSSNGWAPTFVGTLLTSCAPGGLYSDPIYLNESATVTLIVCPSWMSMTNNGTSSSGWTIQGVPTNYGAYQISVKAVSANGLKTSYSNATVWVAMPNANVSANGYILAALVAGFAIFFTTLGYRDGRMWFVAAFLWIVGGLVAFFPISPILTVISLIPGVYYFFMGTFESW